MSNEMERFGKQAVVALSRYYPSICLEGVREIAEKDSQESRCSDRDSNRPLPEYKPEVLPLHNLAQFTHVKLETCNVSVPVWSASRNPVKTFALSPSVHHACFLVSTFCRPLKLQLLVVAQLPINLSTHILLTSRNGNPSRVRRLFIYCPCKT